MPPSACGGEAGFASDCILFNKARIEGSVVVAVISVISLISVLLVAFSN